MDNAGGYEASFVLPVQDDHKCPVCHLVLRDPLQTDCGHRICSSCFKGLASSKNGEVQCPVDHSVVQKTEVFPDNCARREILNLETFCKYRDNGCPWQGTLKENGKHVSTCDYEDVPCPNGCPQIVPRKLLEKHLLETCPLRREACDFCKQMMPRSEIEAHYERCSLYPVECPYNCGEIKIPRINLPEHVKTCPHAEGCCKFSFAGCNFKGSKAELEKHLKSKMYEHLDMSALHASQLDARNLELTKKLQKETRKAEQQEAIIYDQEKKLEATQNQLSTIQTEVKSLENEVFEIRQKGESLKESIVILDKKSGPNMIRDVDSLKLQTQQMEHKVKMLVEKVSGMEKAAGKAFSYSGHMSLPTGKAKSSDDLDRRAERIENQLALQDVQMAELNLKLQLLESTSFNGVLIWKIDNYNRRKRDAVMGKTPSLYSPPFYTSRFGYKMCARIYLNGDGQGKGSHVSLFFVVMRSEYDALLTWPFPCKITMKLLGQDSNPNVVESFRPDPNSSSFRRPSSDMNIASGCPLFVSQSKIASGSYVKKDCIFVEVMVDTSSLPNF